SVIYISMMGSPGAAVFADILDEKLKNEWDVFIIMNFWEINITMLGYFESVVDNMQNCILQNKHRNFWILSIKYIT
ncbi:MAG: hypothetical protein LBV11_02810, partial [Bacillus cereus]|nr:hypothetical protein [Bacillus cereus]